MQASDNTFIIINNAAARARRAWIHIKSVLVQNNICFDAHETTHAGDAEARTREALSRGYRTVAVVGGDGTLSETASGFFEQRTHDDVTPPTLVNPKAALAILPAGTGNDFARGLEGRRTHLEEWLQRLIAHCRHNSEGTTRMIDVLEVKMDDDARNFICLNAVTLGIGAEVVSRVAAQSSFVRRLSGEARFALAAIGALAAWRNRPVRVVVDDMQIECATNLVAITNGPYAGGGMMFAPEARNDDGCLEVVTACNLARSAIVREITRIHHGGHLANPRVRLVRGTRARVETLTSTDALPLEADGNLRGHTPAEISVIPRALRVVF